MIAPSSPTGRVLRWVGDTRLGRRVLGPKVLTRLDSLLHRVTGGRIRAGDALFDTIVLTTTGRRSGRPRSVTLAGWTVDEVRWAVIASNFGRHRHPDWSRNLDADPRASVQYRGETVEVEARRLQGEERERVWADAVAAWPGYATYAETTEGIRSIRVFALEPRPDGDRGPRRGRARRQLG